MFEDSEVTVLKWVIGTPVAVLIAFFAVAYDVYAIGFCLSKIWSWYAVAGFGAPVIGWKVFGVGSKSIRFALTFKGDYTGEDKRDASAKAAAFVGQAIAPWLFLAIAWWLL